MEVSHGTLCFANVNVLNLNCQECGREIIKVGTEDFIQGIEFKTGVIPNFPHEQNKDTGIWGADWGLEENNWKDFYKTVNEF